MSAVMAMAMAAAAAVGMVMVMAAWWRHIHTELPGFVSARWRGRWQRRPQLQQQQQQQQRRLDVIWRTIVACEAYGLHACALDACMASCSSAIECHSSMEVETFARPAARCAEVAEIMPVCQR